MPVLSTPPIDDHILDYHFPETEETTLANGLKLVVLTRPELPRITFRLGFHLGDKYDGDLPGKADLLAALLKKGCRGYTADAFADAIDLMGGYLDSASNNDSFFVYGTFLSEFTEKSLAMMFEAVRFPAFEAGELDREKRRMIADLENEKSSPGYLGQLLLQQKLYPGHPYGAYKTAASLQAIEVAHLREMRDSFLCPQGATLVVCGDTDLAEIRDICQRYGGDWAGAPTGANVLAAPREIRTGGRYFIERPGSEQATVLMGFPLFKRTHGDYPATVVANKILGGGANSRLFMHLREEKGFTYGAYSSLNCYQESGSWIASGDMRSDALLESVRGFEGEFRQMVDKPVDAEELRNAKRFLVGVFPLRNESAAAQSGLVIFQRLFGLPADYWTTYLEEIAAIDAGEIRRIAASYLVPEKMTLVVVGDWAVLQDQMRQIGDCQRLDIHFNAIG